MRQLLSTVLSLVLIVGGLLSYRLYAQAVPVTIRNKTGGGYEMVVGGQPFFIKAGMASNIALLKAIGGNSVRTYSPNESQILRADSAGLKVIVGLPVNQTDALNAVNKFKNNKAILCWAIGNEEETRTGDKAALFREINTISQAIKAADPNHPTLTVVAEIGGNNLQLIAQHAPNLDFVGINSYAGAAGLPGRIAATGWTKPWALTEYGPIGHWEAPKTPWGLPIEQTSTEKAAYYLDVHTRGVKGAPNCLGSVPFLWGQKQEKTHTWYGMFLHNNLGGNPVGSVEAMMYAWTGAYPANRYPVLASPNAILAGDLGNIGTGSKRVFALNQRIDVQVSVTDPENRTLRIEWDLRKDVSGNPVQGGSWEEEIAPIAGAVVSKSGNTARIQLPNVEERYRVYVYVYDDAGQAATANIAIRTDPTLALPLVQRGRMGQGSVEILEKDVQGREGVSRPYDMRFEKHSDGWKIKVK